MKKLIFLIMLLLFPVLTSAINTVYELDQGGNNLLQVTGVTYQGGLQLNFNTTQGKDYCYLSTVTQAPSGAATIAKIYSLASGVLPVAQYSFSGRQANGTYNLTNGTSYYVVVWKSGSSYNMGYNNTVSFPYYFNPIGNISACMYNSTGTFVVGGACNYGVDSINITCVSNPVTIAIEINKSSYNFSSGKTSSDQTYWASSTSIRANTTDTTPTIRFTINQSQSTYCAISLYNLNWTGLNASHYNSSEGNSSTHTATWGSALNYGSNSLYLICQGYNQTSTSTSGSLNITVQQVQTLGTFSPANATSISNGTTKRFQINATWEDSSDYLNFQLWNSSGVVYSANFTNNSLSITADYNHTFTNNGATALIYYYNGTLKKSNHDVINRSGIYQITISSPFANVTSATNPSITSFFDIQPNWSNAVYTGNLASGNFSWALNESGVGLYPVVAYWWNLTNNEAYNTTTYMSLSTYNSSAMRLVCNGANVTSSQVQVLNISTGSSGVINCTYSLTISQNYTNFVLGYDNSNWTWNYSFSSEQKV